MSNISTLAELTEVYIKPAVGSAVERLKLKVVFFGTFLCEHVQMFILLFNAWTKSRIQQATFFFSFLFFLFFGWGVGGCLFSILFF